MLGAVRLDLSMGRQVDDPRLAQRSLLDQPIELLLAGGASQEEGYLILAHQGSDGLYLESCPWQSRERGALPAHQGFAVPPVRQRFVDGSLVHADTQGTGRQSDSEDLALAPGTGLDPLS